MRRWEGGSRVGTTSQATDPGDANFTTHIVVISSAKLILNTICIQRVMDTMSEHRMKPATAIIATSTQEVLNAYSISSAWPQSPHKEEQGAAEHMS